MMQEWFEKAEKASVKGDDSAKDEQPALLSVYNGALAMSSSRQRPPPHGYNRLMRADESNQQ